MYRQYELENLITGARRVCWLNLDQPLSLGTLLTLKGSEDEWEVREVHKTAITNVPDTSWQVGGIIGRMGRR